jgi:hypothetical protein
MRGRIRYRGLSIAGSIILFFSLLETLAAEQTSKDIQLFFTPLDGTTSGQIVAIAARSSKQIQLSIVDLKAASGTKGSLGSELDLLTLDSKLDSFVRMLLSPSAMVSPFEGDGQKINVGFEQRPKNFKFDEIKNDLEVARKRYRGVKADRVEVWRIPGGDRKIEQGLIAMAGDQLLTAPELPTSGTAALIMETIFVKLLEKLAKKPEEFHSIQKWGSEICGDAFESIYGTALRSSPDTQEGLGARNKLHAMIIPVQLDNSPPRTFGNGGPLPRWIQFTINNPDSVDVWLVRNGARQERIINQRPEELRCGEDRYSFAFQAGMLREVESGETITVDGSKVTVQVHGTRIHRPFKYGLFTILVSGAAILIVIVMKRHRPERTRSNAGSGGTADSGEETHTSEPEGLKIATVDESRGSTEPAAADRSDDESEISASLKLFLERVFANLSSQIASTRVYDDSQLRSELAQHFSTINQSTNALPGRLEEVISQLTTEAASDRDRYRNIIGTIHENPDSLISNKSILVESTKKARWGINEVRKHLNRLGPFGLKVVEPVLPIHLTTLADECFELSHQADNVVLKTQNELSRRTTLIQELNNKLAGAENETARLNNLLNSREAELGDVLLISRDQTADWSTMISIAARQRELGENPFFIRMGTFLSSLQRATVALHSLADTWPDFVSEVKAEDLAPAKLGSELTVLETRLRQKASFEKLRFGPTEEAVESVRKEILTDLTHPTYHRLVVHALRMEQLLDRYTRRLNERLLDQGQPADLYLCACQSLRGDLAHLGLRLDELRFLQHAWNARSSGNARVGHGHLELYGLPVAKLNWERAVGSVSDVETWGYECPPLNRSLASVYWIFTS